MKVLFIEDDEEKRDKINKFLIEKYDSLTITDKKSYNSGLKALSKKDDYDIVVMDMSMPNYDVTNDDSDGGTPESFAGRKLLEQMKFRYIDYPVIIVTQFDSFGEYVDKVSLVELKNELEKKFTPFYRGTVYYHSSESDWKDKLKIEIDKVLKEKNA